MSCGPNGRVSVNINHSFNYYAAYGHPPPPSYEGVSLSLGPPLRDLQEERAAAAAAAVRAAEAASSSNRSGRPVGTRERRDLQVFSAADAYEASVLGKRAKESKAVANKRQKRKFRKRSAGK